MNSCDVGLSAKHPAAVEACCLGPSSCLSLIRVEHFQSFLLWRFLSTEQLALDQKFSWKTNLFLLCWAFVSFSTVLFCLPSILSSNFPFRWVHKSDLPRNLLQSCFFQMNPFDWFASESGWKEYFCFFLSSSPTLSFQPYLNCVILLFATTPVNGFWPYIACFFQMNPYG